METIRFGENLKALREKHGLTQNQLGSKIYVDQKTISNWERKRGLPSLLTLQAIAILFNITLDELVYGNRD